MSGPEFVVDVDPNVPPHDMQEGKCYYVRHRQNWSEGRYILPVAERCTKYWAGIICDLLNARNSHVFDHST